MNNLTKEQINLFTVIGSALLLVIFFFIPSCSIKMDFGFGEAESETFQYVNMLSDLGFLYTLSSLLAFLCPLYLILYCYKDKMPALKPIFFLNRKVAGIVLAAVAVVIIILLFTVHPSVMGISIPMSPAFGAYLYLVIALCICYLGTLVKE